MRCIYDLQNLLIQHLQAANPFSVKFAWLAAAAEVASLVVEVRSLLVEVATLVVEVASLVHRQLSWKSLAKGFDFTPTTDYSDRHLSSCEKTKTCLVSTRGASKWAFAVALLTLKYICTYRKTILFDCFYLLRKGTTAALGKLKSGHQQGRNVCVSAHRCV